MPATSSARIIRALAGVAMIAATAACGGGDSLGSDTTSGDSAAPVLNRVDSALTLAEHLRRFREAVGPNPDTLRNAASSVHSLAVRWADAITAQDTGALVAMSLDRAEFAWLVFPDMPMAKPPYEMPPGLLWSQLTGNSDEGLRKALERFEGRRVTVTSAACPTPPEPEGPNLLRQGCVLTLRVDGAPLPAERYFGSIVERDGRFKLVSHANKL
ncbi:MAG: hypothetical protein P3A28_01190 [Gemmatimonadota bacterium]|nr:hypothetical protein [Gemmatimonadota bacterium]